VADGKGQSDLEPIVQSILSDPVLHFEGLLWLWDGPTDVQHLGDVNLVNVFTRILRALDLCRHDARLSRDQLRRISQRARSVLSARKYERYLRCLEGLQPGMASAIRTPLRRLETLGRAVRDDLLRILERKFPPLEAAAKKKMPWERNDVLFVTQEGYAKKQAEIEHHVTVKMKENAKAIGAAAERGDLSENSEYKFALEERDLLSARLGQMNAEMTIAQVLKPEDVPEDFVGVGTRAVFRRVGGSDEYVMHFVGPWDADIEKGWFNYKAPLALSLMGMRVGDTVDLDHDGANGSFELVELSNVLAEVSEA
jgi:transcription elongation factor GreA